MNVEIDTDAGALYLRLRPGRVVNTIELADAVVADVDDAGVPMGIEFVHAEDFGPFLRRHPEVAVLPSRMPYAGLDRGKSWTVEIGGAADETVALPETTATMHGEFVADLLADPLLLDRIPDGATLILIRSGDPPSVATAVLRRAERIAAEGGLPVLQPVGRPLAASPR